MLLITIWCHSAFGLISLMRIHISMALSIFPTFAVENHVIASMKMIGWHYVYTNQCTKTCHHPINFHLIQSMLIATFMLLFHQQLSNASYPTLSNPNLMVINYSCTKGPSLYNLKPQFSFFYTTPQVL